MKKNWSLPGFSHTKNIKSAKQSSTKLTGNEKAKSSGGKGK
jgi:hypothetical protein